MGALLMTFARTVCASCRRSSARGRTCTTRRLRGRWCSHPRRQPSRRRSYASWNSLMLDTHAAVKRLQAASMDERQAEAIVDAL